MEKSLKINSIEYDGITKEHFFPTSYYHETTVSNIFPVEEYDEEIKIENVSFSIAPLNRKKARISEVKTELFYTFKLTIYVEYSYDLEKDKLLLSEHVENFNVSIILDKSEDCLKNTREDYLITSGKVIKHMKNEVIYGASILIALGEFDDNW